MHFINNQLSYRCLTLQQYEVIVKGTRFLWRSSVGKRHIPDTVSATETFFSSSVITFPVTSARAHYPPCRGPHFAATRAIARADTSSFSSNSHRT